MEAYLLEALDTLRGVKRDFEANKLADLMATEEDAALLVRMQEAVGRFAIGALDVQERVYAQGERAFDDEAEDLVTFFEAMQVQIADRLRTLGR